MDKSVTPPPFFAPPKQKNDCPTCGLVPKSCVCDASPQEMSLVFTMKPRPQAPRYVAAFEALPTPPKHAFVLIDSVFYALDTSDTTPFCDLVKGLVRGHNKSEFIVGKKITMEKKMVINEKE